MNSTTPCDLLPVELVRISSDTSSGTTSYNSFTLSRQSSVLTFGTNSSSNSGMFSPFGPWHTVLSRATSAAATAPLSRQVSDTSYGEVVPDDVFSDSFHGAGSSSDLRPIEHHPITTNRTNEELNPINLYNAGTVLLVRIPEGEYTIRAEDFMSPGGEGWSVIGTSSDY